MNPVVAAFVEAINRRDPEALAGLMTEDHVFVDSLGSRVTGRAQMRAGWAGYFSVVPDYSITIQESFGDGDVVLLWGTAQGAYAQNRWQTPAAWRAVVRGTAIAEWRVFADNEPIRRIMSRGAGSQPAAAS